jgi:predicted KAP-like P-loop ATPase
MLKKREFNFIEYSAVLSSLIRQNLERADKPIVIGIHGEWGSGKSTLLDEITIQIEKTNTPKLYIVPIKFNAWRFEKEKHLIIPLLKTLYYELDKLKYHHSDENRIKTTLSYIKDGLFSIISGIELELEIGFVKAKYTGKESVAYVDKRYIERKKENKEKSKNFSNRYESIYFDIINKIAQLTQNNHIRFLFLIDDLDRCLPENSVKMLESIKLFLDINNCAFVMAIDKEVVELGVEYNYKDYKKISDKQPITGNEYLEKMITLPFLLPSIQKDKIRDFIVRNYHELFKEKDDEELLNLFCDTVPTIPRKVIRALDLYSFKKELNKKLNTNIDKKIILVVSLIELFISDLYKYIKKEFERDRDGESEIFGLLIDIKYNSSEKSILDISIDNKLIREILKRFNQSRNKFNIDKLFEFILDYDNFQKDLKGYFIFNKKHSNEEH